MIRALLSVQLRSLLSGLTKQTRRGKSTGTMVLFAVLYIYLGVVIAGGMAAVFSQLIGPYHAAGLDWLYFATAGIMALGFSLFGCVFTTQSQLYDAKDNHLLLSMPIPPAIILLSRMLILLGMNLVFSGLVLVPAAVVYGLHTGVNGAALTGQILGLLGITLAAQAISCLLGWLFHLMLKRVNRSLFSVVYMVVFLVGYFSIFGQSNQILTSLLDHSQDNAQAIRSFVWPVYAMGMGASGSVLHSLTFFGICAAIFSVSYNILSKTFLNTAGGSHASSRRKALRLENHSTRSPVFAIMGKELMRFMGTPIYITNAGIGILMTAAMTVAAIIFQKDLRSALAEFGIPQGAEALLVVSALGFLNSTIYISAPSVSLEGKSLWVMKSMPVSGKTVLQGKLSLHLMLSVPVIFPAALILSLVLGCGILSSLLCGLLCSLCCVFCGLLGMITGLKWAKFDYINDAYPVKQAVFVVVTMFGSMAVPVVLGLLFGFALSINPALYLLLSILFLAGICFVLYRLLMGWGQKKWNNL